MLKSEEMISRSSSGVTGVSFAKRDGKWRAYVTVARKQIFLGQYSTKDEAISARRQANIRHGFHQNHGRKA
jgi:hypothetical protein